MRERNNDAHRVFAREAQDHIGRNRDECVVKKVTKSVEICVRRR
jgi:hypothetical protein